MKIPEKLMEFKYQIIFITIFSLIIFSLFILAPKFLNLLAYFWPLFLSTALFLVAVVVFGTSSSSYDATTDIISGEGGLIDYVAAGQPEHAQTDISGDQTGETLLDSGAEKPEEAAGEIKVPSLSETSL